MRTCPQCESENKDSAKFCEECGVNFRPLAMVASKTEEGPKQSDLAAKELGPNINLGSVLLGAKQSKKYIKCPSCGLNNLAIRNSCAKCNSLLIQESSVSKLEESPAQSALISTDIHPSEPPPITALSDTQPSATLPESAVGELKESPKQSAFASEEINQNAIAPPLATVLPETKQPLILQKSAINKREKTAEQDISAAKEIHSNIPAPPPLATVLPETKRPLILQKSAASELKESPEQSVFA